MTKIKYRDKDGSIKTLSLNVSSNSTDIYIGNEEPIDPSCKVWYDTSTETPSAKCKLPSGDWITVAGGGGLDSGAITEHNTDTTSHADIRYALQEYLRVISDILVSDDETLARLTDIVAYIKNNRKLIESVTTDKVNITDITDNLTTTFVNKPLSANMGKVLNEKIEDVQKTVENFDVIMNSDEVYIMKEGDTEEDIPEGVTVVVYPDDHPEIIDWSGYYNKEEINEIIKRADFKKGKSAYEVAVEFGFEGTEEEWLQSLKGKSAFEIACELGFEGTSEEWLDSLKPKKGTDYFDGKDGFTPTVSVEEEPEGVSIKITNVSGDPTTTFIRDGKDGFTPQRGEHYWTPSDISTIQNYVDYLVSELVDSAPETLNTLWELANALGNDPNFATTVANEIGRRVEKVEGMGLSSNDFTNAEKMKLAGLQNLPIISNKGNTGNDTWYFPLGTMVIDDSSNFGNFTFNGRIGGWVNTNSAVYSISLLNRANYTGDIVTSMVSASGEVSNALSVCDIVVSKNDDKSHTVYLKCIGYFLFNFEWSAYQHSITYDGSYTTTEPSNIIWSLSTAPKTILSSNGVFYANGKELITKEEVQSMFTQFAKDYLGDYKWRVLDTASTGYVTIKR